MHYTSKKHHPLGPACSVSSLTIGLKVNICIWPKCLDVWSSWSLAGGFFTTAGDRPGPNSAQNQNEKFAKNLESSHKEKFDGAWSEVFSQLPETECPGPEETEEGGPEPLRTFAVAETSAVYASINWELRNRESDQKATSLLCRKRRWPDIWTFLSVLW